MNEPNNSKTLADELARAAELIGGKPWGLNIGKPRIYMPVWRKDAKVYFDFPEAGALGLGKPILKVWIDECGQHPNWYKSEANRLRATFAAQLLALYALVFFDDEEMARILLETDDVDEKKLAEQLENGRIDQVRAALGASNP